MILTRHLIISGRVQGVWYRESMRLEAERLGVTGWVRNRDDGAVEAVVQGEDEVLAAIIDWCWKGPPAARVEHIAITPAEGEFGAFERRPSA